MYNRFHRYINPLPEVGYSVELDGNSILLTKNYLHGLAACIAWRKNNPREDKKRISMKIV